MLPEKRKKMVEISNGQYQLVPFAIYVHFESILKAIDEQYRKKVNEMKAAVKDKTPYAENININALSRWFVYITFDLVDVLDH